MFVIAQQMNRAVISIPSNFAEGAGRRSEKEFCNFLSIANGSVYELETQLIIAFELQYIEEPIYRELMELNTYIQKMIYRLTESIRKKLSLVKN